MELIINIFSLVGSLALFLFGMKTMSEGLEKFAGDRLRSILAATMGAGRLHTTWCATHLSL